MATGGVIWPAGGCACPSFWRARAASPPAAPRTNRRLRGRATRVRRGAERRRRSRAKAPPKRLLGARDGRRRRPGHRCAGARRPHRPPRARSDRERDRAEDPHRAGTALLRVKVAKRGYAAAEQRFQFRNHPVGVRIYQPKLQWTMYGANPGRTQAQTRSASGRLSRSSGAGRRRADGVPGRRRRRRRLRRQLHGQRPRLVDARRRARLAPRPRREHGLLARGRGRRGDRPRDGRPRLGARPPQRPGALAQHDRRADRVVAGRARTASTTSAPGTARSTRSTCARIGPLDATTPGAKITSSAAYVGGTIYIGDYGGRLLALSERTGRLRWSGSVNGRIYGTPAIAIGRVFVPSSTGDSLTAFSTQRRTALVARHRLVRLLLARRLGRPRLLRLLQRPALLPSRPRSGGIALALRQRRLDRRRGGGRRRGRLLRGTAGTASTGSNARTGRQVTLPGRRFRAGLRQRAPPAAARLLAAVRGGTEEPRR